MPELLPGARSGDSRFPGNRQRSRRDLPPAAWRDSRDQWLWRSRGRGRARIPQPARRALPRPLWRAPWHRLRPQRKRRGNDPAAVAAPWGANRSRRRTPGECGAPAERSASWILSWQHVSRWSSGSSPSWPRVGLISARPFGISAVLVFAPPQQAAPAQASAGRTLTDQLRPVSGERSTKRQAARKKAKTTEIAEEEPRPRNPQQSGIRTARPTRAPTTT
ncbi:hypothetical protein SBA1_820090 [Candidatus Sulfotelmatobacter kueseliae]|uniref:Uncharacterized protein n=1 Tax=Candidatus Sulfotelmatobacter kueseliae TaxID=2042962 RepID=A0A2U3L8T5_9BACT|nr:hypothetical protein SBA1_820090 [Candidatus Sulfotelmatobacter kueseliae]